MSDVVARTRLVRWLLHESGQAHSVLAQLVVGRRQHGGEGDVALQLDLMRVLDADPQLAAQLMHGDIATDHLVELVLLVEAELLPAHEHAARLRIRFCNHPLPPSFPTRPDVLKSFLGVVHSVSLAICISDEGDKGPSLRQELKIVPRELHFGAKRGGWKARAQSLLLALDDEFVDAFSVGDVVCGVGSMEMTMVKHARVLKVGRWCVAVNNIRRVQNNVLLIDPGHETRPRLPGRPQSVLVRVPTPTQQLEVSRDYFYKGCNVSEWKTTCSLLDQFGAGIVPAFSYRKVKLLLLLSLVSEPRAVGAQQSAQHNPPPPKTSCDTDTDGGGAATTVALSMHSIETLQQSDGMQQDERISLLFISDCVLLSRLVRFASHFYPLGSSVFLNADPDLGHLANGALLLWQGSLFSSKREFDSLRNELLLKKKSRLCRSRVVWCLCPTPTNSREEKAARQLSTPGLFEAGLRDRRSREHIDDEEERQTLQLAFEHCQHKQQQQQQASKETSERLMEHISNARRVVCRFVEHAGAEQCRLMSASFVLLHSMSDAAKRLIKSFFMVCRATKRYPMSALRTAVRCARAHARLHLRTSVELVDGVVGLMLMEEGRGEHGVLFRHGSRGGSVQYGLRLEYAYNVTAGETRRQLMMVYDDILGRIRQRNAAFDPIE